MMMTMMVNARPTVELYFLHYVSFICKNSECLFQVSLSLRSQSQHFSGTTNAGSIAPVHPFAWIAVDARVLTSVGFVTFNMKTILKYGPVHTA